MTTITSPREEIVERLKDKINHTPSDGPYGCKAQLSLVLRYLSNKNFIRHALKSMVETGKFRLDTHPTKDIALHASVIHFLRSI